MKLSWCSGKPRDNFALLCCHGVVVRSSDIFCLSSIQTSRSWISKSSIKSRMHGICTQVELHITVSWIITSTSIRCSLRFFVLTSPTLLLEFAPRPSSMQRAAGTMVAPSYINRAGRWWGVCWRWYDWYGSTMEIVFRGRPSIPECPQNVKVLNTKWSLVLNIRTVFMFLLLLYLRIFNRKAQLRWPTCNSDVF